MKNPRQPYWKPQHEAFIRAMLKYEDATKAYRTAYPKTRPASARVGGARLYNYPHIRQRLESVLQLRRREASRLALQEGAERERRQQLRRAEMRHMLYKVVMKKIKKKRVFVIDKQEFIVEEGPSHSLMLDALVLDLRLEAGYDNWPVIERRFNRIMARLLPPQKQQQRLLPNPSAPNSPFEGGHQCAALMGGCSRTGAGKNTLNIQTSPSAPFKGGTDRPNASAFVDTNEKTLFHQQTVTNSPASPIRQARSGEYPKQHCYKMKPSAESVVQTFYPAPIDEPANTDERTLFCQHSVTNSPAKALRQGRSCEHPETALLQNESISGIGKPAESVVQAFPISATHYPISKNP